MRNDFPKQFEVNIIGLAAGCPWPCVHYGAAHRQYVQMVPSMALLLQVHLCGNLVLPIIMFSILFAKNYRFDIPCPMINPLFYIFTNIWTTAPGVPPKSLDAAVGGCEFEAIVPLEQHWTCQGVVIGKADQGRIVGLAYHVNNVLPKIPSNRVKTKVWEGVSTHHEIHWPCWGPAGRSCSFGWALCGSLWEKACHWQQAASEGFSVLWPNSGDAFYTPSWVFRLGMLTVFDSWFIIPSHSFSQDLHQSLWWPDCAHHGSATQWKMFPPKPSGLWLTHSTLSMWVQMVLRSLVCHHVGLGRLYSLVMNSYGWKNTTGWDILYHICTENVEELVCHDWQCSKASLYLGCLRMGT